MPRFVANQIWKVLRVMSINHRCCSLRQRLVRQKVERLLEQKVQKVRLVA
jgi:hypothetical protein